MAPLGPGMCVGRRRQARGSSLLLRVWGCRAWGRGLTSRKSLISVALSPNLRLELWAPIFGTSLGSFAT